MHARLQHARIVEHHEVATPQQARQVGEGAIVAPHAVDVQQPAVAALRRRHLRDQFRRQRVVEIRERVGTGQGVVPGGDSNPHDIAIGGF